MTTPHAVDTTRAYRTKAILSHLLLRAVLVALLAVTAAQVTAEDGTVIRFPIGGRTRFASGLKMEVDTRWVEAQGYRPIRIKLGTVNGALNTADRTVDVVIKPRSRVNGEEQADEISTSITLPEGKAEVTATVLVLQEALWNQIEIETYEDNFQLLDMSGAFTASSSARRINQYMGWDQDAISYLIIDSDVPERSKRTTGTSGVTPATVTSLPATTPSEPNKLPDIRALALQIPDPVANYNIYQNNTPVISPDNDPANALSDAQLLDWLATRSNFEMLPPNEVPARWLELTCFDFIIVSLDEAQVLEKTHPRRWEAVRRWVHAGGNLIISGFGDAQGLPEIDKLLGEADPSPGWTLAPTAKNSTSVDFVSESTNRMWNGQELPKIDISKDKPTTGYFTVQTRRSGLGSIAAIQESEVFPGTRRQWTSLVNAYPSWRSLWSVRNGVSLTRSNGDSFWQFAIPGFGMAPVMLFVGLISVFVIILGPVNYAWLKRQNRLSLMIFTVPIGALITIFSLSAYAILGDGLYTRARVWSITDIDQRTGHGTSWSHQTYYAGIPPWGGLSFPSDAAVYPVDQLEEGTGYYDPYSMRRDARVMNWEKAQNLRRGYIASRTLSQFVVIQPIQSDAKVVIKDGNVTNQLGVPIKHLVIRGESDDLQYCGALSPGATTALSSFGKVEQEAVADLFAGAKPQMMEGFDSVAYSSAMTSNSRRYYYANSRTYTASAEGDGILMEEIAAAEEPNEIKRKLAPRTYYAVVEKSPNLPLGTDSAIEVMSLHVVRGRW